jgi:hypothetical protein
MLYNSKLTAEQKFSARYVAVKDYNHDNNKTKSFPIYDIKLFQSVYVLFENPHCEQKDIY